MNVRTYIRQAAVSMLSDPAIGFNAKIAAAVASNQYAALKAFEIDFQPGSANFIQAFYAGDAGVDVSPISDFPALVLYTSSAENERREKGYGFSGSVALHLDFYLYFRRRYDDSNGIENFDTESIADAVEDAILAIFHSTAAAWPPGVTYDGSFSSSRDPIQPAGDGWTQRVPILLSLGVSA